jgi:hypothetical protein
MMFEASLPITARRDDRKSQAKKERRERRSEPKYYLLLCYPFASTIQRIAGPPTSFD